MAVRSVVEAVAGSFGRRFPGAVRALARSDVLRTSTLVARVDPGGAVRRRLQRASLPPPGRVRFGDLRRTRPIATDFGYGRGGPVDRHYIEGFLAEHSRDVRGRVLEIGDSTYTHRFGGPQVTRAEALHVDPDAGATFTGDIADGSFLPSDAFDCVVLTQTLHLVYDFHGALRTIARILAPGGVLLITVPGISNMDSGEWGGTWHYAFTHHSLARIAADHFDGFDVRIRSYGNILAATAFLHGLGVDELTTEELDDHHVEYSLIHAARIAKPNGTEP